MAQASNSFWLPKNNPSSPASTLSPPTAQERSYTVTSPRPSSQQPSQPSPHHTQHPTPQHHAPGSLSVYGQPSPSSGPHMSLVPGIYQPPSKWDVVSSSSLPPLYPYGPRPWIQPQENTYSSPNFPNGHERLSTYRSLTSALTGTRALQSIENKIDRIEALAYQKDVKSVATVDKGSSLVSQDREALEGMMKSHFDSFLGQVAGSVGQMVHQEVGQHLSTVHTAMIKDFGAAQESVMTRLQESREQNRAETSREIKAQLQELMESIKAEGTIRHQGTEERLAKLLSDWTADIQGIQREQERQAAFQEQRNHKETQDVMDSVQELREAVEKMVPALHTLETNDLARQREMRHMISEQQQVLVAAHRARHLDKDEESKRNLEVDENFSAIETQVAELAEDFSELAEKLMNQHEGLGKEIEGLKRQQAQILTSLQENHHQQQQYLESILQSPVMSEVASGTTLVDAPQAASAARQRAMRPTHRSRATEPNGPPHGPPNNGRENPEAPTDPSLSNSNNGQIIKRKRIKIEPGTIPKPAERTMTTRMMSKVLGGIVT